MRYRVNTVKLIEAEKEQWFLGNGEKKMGSGCSVGRKFQFRELIKFQRSAGNTVLD